MPEKFKIQINESEPLNLTSDDAEKLDFVKISDKEFHIIYNNQSVTVELVDSDFQERKYSLKINGKRFDAKIQNELDMLIEDMGFELNSATNINNIIAPMPGLILSIEVEEGQEVKENDPVLILEAMKMENVLVAPKNATVKSIKVEKGETVDKNELLVEFE